MIMAARTARRTASAMMPPFFLILEEVLVLVTLGSLGAELDAAISLVSSSFWLSRISSLTTTVVEDTVVDTVVGAGSVVAAEAETEELTVELDGETVVEDELATAVVEIEVVEEDDEEDDEYDEYDDEVDEAVVVEVDTCLGSTSLPDLSLSVLVASSMVNDSGLHAASSSPVSQSAGHHTPRSGGYTSPPHSGTLSCLQHTWRHTWHCPQPDSCHRDTCTRVQHHCPGCSRCGNSWQSDTRHLHVSDQV